MMKDKLSSFFKIFGPLILGGIVAFVIKDYMNYSDLVQPPLSPPSIVFPIVWTILYLLMGISYYLFSKENRDSSISFLYKLQLGINLIWPILFFNFRWYFFSILWILLLVVCVWMYFKKLWNGNYKRSAYLLIPYLIWLMIATYLNIGVYLLN